MHVNSDMVDQALELYDRLVQQTSSFFLRKGLADSRGSAESVVQQWFLRLLNLQHQRGQLFDENRPTEQEWRKYVYKSVRNAARDFIRENNRRRKRHNTIVSQSRSGNRANRVEVVTQSPDDTSDSVDLVDSLCGILRTSGITERETLAWIVRWHVPSHLSTRTHAEDALSEIIEAKCDLDACFDRARKKVRREVARSPITATLQNSRGNLRLFRLALLRSLVDHYLERWILERLRDDQGTEKVVIRDMRKWESFQRILSPQMAAGVAVTVTAAIQG